MLWIFKKKFADFQEYVYWIQTNKHPDRQTDRQAKFTHKFGISTICFGDENHACVRNKWSKTKLKSCYFMGLWEKDLIGDNSMSI